MHKIICFLIFFVAFLSINTYSQAPVSPNPFYNVKVSLIDSLGGVPLQAFSTGRKGDTLLLITGRTNGFHNFPNIPVAAFPNNRSNDSIIVFIPSKLKGKSKTFKASLFNILSNSPVITNDQIYQLASTNIQSCQSGDTLYGVGGYGYNAEMVTFAKSFAINVPRMINLVLRSARNKPITQGAVDSAIAFAPDNLLCSVTGGELIQMNKKYYLVTGQSFFGEYNNGPFASNNLNGYKQLYTSSIIQLSFNWNTDTSFNCIAKTVSYDNVNLHRRDLNVVPIIDSFGNQAIHIYGGVFTPTQNGGPYLQPIEITGSGDAIALKVVSMNQYFNQYAAAHFSIFDAASNSMFTSILGGITLYDSVGKSINDSLVINAQDSTMPWSSIISTNVKKGNSITEYASDNVRLPGLIGGESKFVPYHRFVIPGTDDIINSAALRKYADSVNKSNPGSVAIPIGYMFGGIHSSLAQTLKRSNTYSNPSLYLVSVTLSGLLNGKPYPKLKR